MTKQTINHISNTCLINNIIEHIYKEQDQVKKSIDDGFKLINRSLVDHLIREKINFYNQRYTIRVLISIYNSEKDKLLKLLSNYDMDNLTLERIEYNVERIEVMIEDLMCTMESLASQITEIDEKLIGGKCYY